jgi:hypothetical protein
MSAALYLLAVDEEPAGGYAELAAELAALWAMARTVQAGIVWVIARLGELDQIEGA